MRAVPVRIARVVATGKTMLNDDTRKRLKKATPEERATLLKALQELEAAPPDDDDTDDDDVAGAIGKLTEANTKMAERILALEKLAGSPTKKKKKGLLDSIFGGDN